MNPITSSNPIRQPATKPDLKTRAMPSETHLSKKGKGFMVLTHLFKKIQKTDRTRMWSDHEDWSNHQDSPW